MKLLGHALLTVIFFAAWDAQALDSFGGSCASQGEWTRGALDQSRAIADAITALRDDPNCKGIESILPKVQQSFQELARPHGEDGLEANRLETLPSEINALRNYLATKGPLSSQATQTLASKTLEVATLPLTTSSADFTALKQRTARASSYGISLLDEVMNTLPKYELCMNNNPNQAAAIFGAAIQMAGAFASSGGGVSSRLGNTVGNMVSFLRNKKYAKMLRKLNESQYWSSISCLMETTAQSYCSANEAYQLLDYQRGQGKAVNTMSSDNPMNGYYLLVRELPTVAAWLQRVQFGVTPKLSTDATFKNQTLDSVNNLQKSVNGLKGMYAEEVLQYNTLTDPRAKRNAAYQMVNDLALSIQGNSADPNTFGGGGGGGPGNRNFYTTTVLSDMIPFYLVGLDSMPPETAANKSGGYVMTWNQWMVNGGAYQPMFNDPDNLVRMIGQRLDQIIEGALEQGSAYFRQRMVVDNQNLVDDSVTSSTVSVVESLKNIRKYLNDLLTRTKSDPDRGIVIIPSLVDTIQRIDRVLDSYDQVKKKVAAIMEVYTATASLAPSCFQGEQGNQTAKTVEDLLSKIDGKPVDTSEPMDMNRLSDELKQRINQAYVNVVSTAYDQFNVLLQKDGFLSTRVSTFVKFDYSERIRKQENMSAYQKQIMVVSGKNILDQLVQVHQLNPAQSELDLANAQVVNTKNLEAVDQLASNSLYDAIVSLNKTRAGGRVPAITAKTVRDSLILAGAEGAPVDLGIDLAKDSTRVAPSKNDDNGSFESFRSKLCIQSLAFDDWVKFTAICQGSVLKSRFQASDPKVKLDLSYDQLAASRPAAKQNWPYVCALRNYLQQNQVYWLTQQSQ